MPASSSTMRAVRALVIAGASGTTIAGALLFGPTGNDNSGLEGNRNTAYRDSVGIPTICGGVTEGVYMGQYKSPEECADLNADALQESGVDTVRRCAPPGMPNSVEAAMISFAYNVGPGRKGVKDGFCVLHTGAQPKILRYLHAGDYRAACNGLIEWSNAGGKPSVGVRNRRLQEIELCLLGLPLASRSSLSLPFYSVGLLTGGVLTRVSPNTNWIALKS